MLVVPQTLADGLIRACGDAGRRWIECLPERVERLCAEWGLQLVEEQPPYGDWNLVLFARRGREPCVLKIFGPDPRATDEARALTTWAGRGAVLPLEVSADQGGVVLERLDPTRSLTGVSLKLAAETAGSLIRQLTVPPRRDCHCWSMSHGTMPRRSLDSEGPGRSAASPVDRARRPGRLRSRIRDGNSLVHGDLHYGNVLAGTRQPCLAIDPKPVTGNPERSVAELMWDRIDDAPDAAAVRELFTALIRAGDLDPDRAWAWTILQTVNYWLWGLSAGLTEDPVRCHRLLDTLA